MIFDNGILEDLSSVATTIPIISLKPPNGLLTTGSDGWKQYTIDHNSTASSYLRELEIPTILTQPSDNPFKNLKFTDFGANTEPHSEFKSMDAVELIEFYNKISENPSFQKSNKIDFDPNNSASPSLAQRNISLSTIPNTTPSAIVPSVPFITELPILATEKKQKILERGNNIISLLIDVCVTNPMRIKIPKIIRTIESIDLAWIAAICLMDYISMADIDLQNLALQSLMAKIHDAISMYIQGKVQLSPITRNQQYEVDMVFAEVIKCITNFYLPPAVVKEILQNIPYLTSVCDYGHQIEKDGNSTLEGQHREKETPEPEIQLVIALREDPNRPSSTCYSHTKDLYLELERQIIESKITYNITHSTLWSSLLQNLNSQVNSPFELRNNRLYQKNPPKTWTKSDAYYHLTKVIKWYESIKIKYTA
jgi:hypothetical protein